MAEIDIGGFKIKGGKGITVLMIVGTMIGTLYGGFEVYKDYMDMKKKLADLDVDAIAAKNAVLETKLEEAISYVKDIKDGLRSDVIGVEKALGDVERRIRDVESENRILVKESKDYFDKTVKESKRYFDDKTAAVDDKLNAMEERLNKRVQRALDNPLLKDMQQ